MNAARLNSPEFTLLLACCRWNFATATPDRPQLPDHLNWAKLVELARYHRVQGLIWNALPKANLPQAATALYADAQWIAANNLAIARECSGLRDDFAKRRMPHLFVKGLTVAALAYRSPMLKMGWDIDVLIDPGDLDKAAQALEGRGFSLRLPARRGGLARWHRRSKESVWRRDDGLNIELHTRLADNANLIPSLDVHSPARQVEIAPGIALSTLADEQLFAYLAVHGASSAWFRLKWIADFAGLLAARSGKEIEHLYRRSQELGSGRAAGQALLLADQLFGSLRQVPALRAALECSRSTRQLRSGAMAMLGRRPVDPTAERFGTFPIHWTQLLLLPGPSFKLSELRRQASEMARERMK